MADKHGTLKSIIAALAANLGIALCKFVAFLFTGSSSMLAEAVHSLADTANQVLLLIGGRAAKKPANRLHPFGYARFRYFYGFLVTMVIFLVGGLFALADGVEKLLSPQKLDNPVWAFAVLGVSVVLEGFSLRTAIKESGRKRGSWLSFVRQAKAPEIPVVLFEDSGALTGLAFALAGVTLATITGDGRWDAVGSLGIGALLVVISILLSLKMRSLLIGESADERVLATIEDALRAEPMIDEVIHLRTMHLGPEQLLIAAKVAIGADQPMHRVAETINSAEKRVRDCVRLDCLIFLEPDLLDPDRLPAGDHPAGATASATVAA